MENLRMRPARRTISILGAVLAAAASFPTIGRADVKQVRLGVKGATCATCAFALRKGFKRIEGVADAKLVTKPPFMHVRPKPGLWPDTARMQEMIKDTGFQPVPDQVELTATGTLVRGEKGLRLTLDGMKDPVAILVSPPPPAGSNALDLEPFLGRPVEVEGKWKAASGPGGEGTLTLSAIHLQK